MLQIYDMGPTALLCVLRIFFALKNPTASAGFEPANLGTKGQHDTPRPPKPLSCIKDPESYDDFADLNVHWAGKNAVSYKEKSVKRLQVDNSAIVVW
jgi:hypothetical protein